MTANPEASPKLGYFRLSHDRLRTREVSLLLSSTVSDFLLFVRYSLKCSERAVFAKFSEKARLVIFFATGQASVFGTQEITPEFLLLGMLQQRPPLELSRLIGGDADHWDGLRKQIEEDIPRGNPVPLSAGIPVSEELGRVFQYAIEEMSSTGLEKVQPGHLVIGILREEGSHAAELLRANGADLGLARQRMLKPQ